MHSLSSAQHAFHHLDGQKTAFVADVDQHLAGLLESLPETFGWLDRQGHVTYLNQQAECLLQRPREALLGQTLWEVFPEAVGSSFSRQPHAAGEAPPLSILRSFLPL